MTLKTFLVFFLAFFITSCVPASAQIESPKPTIIERGKDATVAFVDKTISEKEITYPSCSGVWINKDTILTALHCAKGAARREKIRKLPPELREYAPLLIEEVEDPTGFQMTYIVEQEVNGLEEEPKATHESHVIAIDSTHDMALVKADGITMPQHSWLRIADYNPKVGSKVYVIGHQGGLYFSVMDGMVSAIRETYPHDEDDTFNVEGPLLQIFSGIYRGNSGGAVISENGELIGIVSFTARAPNQGFAIAPPAIKRFVIKTHYKNLIK